jgi:MFS family permease
MAVLSLGISAKLVMRFGLKPPLSIGLLLGGAGLLLYTLAPVDGNYWLHVFPGMVLLGLGGGVAFNPLLLAAMNDVQPEDSGLASGMVNTAFMMGGALGLAILASLADARTAALLAAGVERNAALTGGYHLAFLVGGGFALVAALLGAWLIRDKQPAPAPESKEAAAA